MLVHLLPLGRGRFDLYAEPRHVDVVPPAHDAGRVRRWLHAAGEKWRSLVDAARMGEATGRLARWRDGAICKVAESLDEQRTLWSLRGVTASTAVFPSNLSAADVRGTLKRILAAARRHHGRWFAIYLILFIVSGVLAVIPGPNILAYYLGFQAFGHLQSWLGARQGAAAVQWSVEPNDALAELGTLAELPHGTRAARVEAIAHRLELPHLPAFFERAAA